MAEFAKRPSGDEGKGCIEPENAGRKQDGQFAPGVSGNPAGRPRGARNRTTLAVEALLSGEAEGVARALIVAALGGDVSAMKMVLDRVAPIARHRIAPIEMAELSDPSKLPNALMALFNATVAGGVAPADAGDIARLGETYRRACETADIERRLTVLEAQAVESGALAGRAQRNRARGPRT